MTDTKDKILLIEDDLDLIEMYKMKFIEEGFDVAVSARGAEGLELAKKESPNIILLDIILPEMDGFAVLEELKKDGKTKDIPVILLSNLGQDSDKEKGKTLGAAEYLVKADFTPAQVTEKIRTFIR